MVSDTRRIIEKWYHILRFPAAYDAAFYEALNSVPVPAALTPEQYDPDSRDGKRNLLTFLYFCEQACRRAAALGIPERVMTDTLGDIVIWTEYHTERTGGLYLGELRWLSSHVSLRLFRLGRLQFRMGRASRAIPEAGVAEGDPVLEIHIPRGGRLAREECLSSVARAKAFFPRYFPDFPYRAMTCRSWLLDETLRKYLPENSHILSFADLFVRVFSEEKNALFKYVFAPGVSDPAEAVCVSGFAERIRDAYLAGEKFHEVLGYLPDK